MNKTLPTLVAHADWSCRPGKRWGAKAKRHPAGHYLASAPENIVDPGHFLEALWDSAHHQACVLVGFDFPIGLPIEYARKGEIHNFLEFLTQPGEGKGDWSDFFKVAETYSEISLQRPFYPLKPGRARQEHLRQGLGIHELKRGCEKRTKNRRAACPLFWTLGAQQVGKAALNGWQTVLQPALIKYAPRTKIWPFSGRLPEILKPGNLVMIETYPAEFYFHLGIAEQMTSRKLGGKRSQVARQRVAETLLVWASDHEIFLEEDLRSQIRSGFGDHPDGEDRFDAVIGLLGILNILIGNQPLEEPENEAIRQVEGWIFGQKDTS